MARVEAIRTTVKGSVKKTKAGWIWTAQVGDMHFESNAPYAELKTACSSMSGFLAEAPDLIEKNKKRVISGYTEAEVDAGL